ncbi:MAG: 2-deoxy-D-gluconate 3-dehydrogenase [Deltaproteobacteria bacterium]|nr:2-deoxy-D-gluconate 3-dehydrogenase [Deltaproteobacteria bacterium]
MKNLFDISGRVAIVTGGSKGIGLQMALDLAEAGAEVVIASRHLNEAQATVDRVKEKGRRGLAIQADISLVPECAMLIRKTVETFGKVDILVNNAGMNQRGPLIEVVENQYDKIMATDLKGLFFCSQFAVKEMMKQKWGRIVNITSAAAVIGVPILGIYCAAKAGAAQLTKVCALEWAQFGVTVNAIGPYYVQTDINKDFLAVKANYDRIVSKVAIKRLGEPGDLTGTLLLLVSDAGAYITGQSLYVEGGAMAGWPAP